MVMLFPAALFFILGGAVIIIFLTIVFLIASRGSGSRDHVNFQGPSHSDDTPGVNPATGLPMVGPLDIAGNPFGSAGPQVNPATGLPMVGGVDVGGNPFGTSPPHQPNG